MTFQKQSPENLIEGTKYYLEYIEKPGVRVTDIVVFKALTLRSKRLQVVCELTKKRGTLRVVWSQVVSYTEYTH